MPNLLFMLKKNWVLELNEAAKNNLTKIDENCFFNLFNTQDAKTNKKNFIPRK
jgi:hypothetical protein